MPGNVQSAGSVSDTYPFTRFRQFALTLRLECAITEFPDGSSQRRKKQDNHRRSWSVGHRLSATDAATLRTFYRSHIISPFRFKDVSNGVTYTAVFCGPYQEQRDQYDRFTFSLQLQEIL